LENMNKPDHIEPLEHPLPARLSRLTKLGPATFEQLPFLLPRSWLNADQPIDCWNTLITEQDMVLVQGYIQGPLVRSSRGHQRFQGSLLDRSGQILQVVIFGPNLLAQTWKPDELLWLYGRLSRYGPVWQLQQPKSLPSHWRGAIMPLYPGKKNIIRDETVREYMLEWLPQAIPWAVQWFNHKMPPQQDIQWLLSNNGLSHWNPAQLLQQAHLPDHLAFGQKAHRVMDQMSAMMALGCANKPITASKAAKPKIHVQSRRFHSLPFKITPEQKKALDQIMTDLNSGHPMRHLLSGDVGSGKTVVYALAASACADNEQQVAVLLPSQVLAMQIYHTLRQWWPDLSIGMISQKEKQIPEATSILIGTTSLLYSDLLSPRLVIIDEQHKFSRAQREQMIGDQTDLLEVTATCIPRSLALARFHFTRVSQLRGNHITKDIVTRIWHKDQKLDLFQQIADTLANDRQVLIIYPLRHANDDTSVQSVTEAVDAWERWFPGAVSGVHGGMDPALKELAVQQMRSGEKKILIATTVIEVGIDLPGLQRVVIIQADRYGLATLHQIRGRVARQGGKGYCDLFLSSAPSEKTMERLSALEKSNDGFTLARLDLQLRGFGDISSDSDAQTGWRQGLLFQRSINPKAFIQVLNMLERQQANS